MSVADDLTVIQNDLTALTAGVAQAVTDLNVPTVESVGDTFLAASVTALEAAGYTVTPPAAPETETSSEDTGDASTEA